MLETRDLVESNNDDKVKTEEKDSLPSADELELRIRFSKHNLYATAQSNNVDNDYDDDRQIRFKPTQRYEIGSIFTESSKLLQIKYFLQLRGGAIVARIWKGTGGER